MGNCTQCTVMKSVPREFILNGHDNDYNPLTLSVTVEFSKLTLLFMRLVQTLYREPFCANMKSYPVYY